MRTPPYRGHHFPPKDACVSIPQCTLLGQRDGPGISTSENRTPHYFSSATLVSVLERFNCFATYLFVTSHAHFKLHTYSTVCFKIHKLISPKDIEFTPTLTALSKACMVALPTVSAATKWYDPFCEEERGWRCEVGRVVFITTFFNGHQEIYNRERGREGGRGRERERERGREGERGERGRGGRGGRGGRDR